ncbi:hypothetical protein QMO56_18860 [Roseomonas sp. E05]|uniref:hypothetical protein n=1 Tax=Roseomonas sp. E05 TaxID=3046310 RepID=UPI0024B90BAE|nr:hypothetical protein [Roseomonas sp. E05]MDJ0390175.1 hypothetical protein [Roseomonas sp. E05]
MRKLFLATLPVLTLLGPLAACSEGPAERSGEKIDRAGQNLRDAVDPPSGPGERMGRSIDRTLN